MQTVCQRVLTLEGQVRNLEALMRTLRSRDDRGVADQRVVDTRVRHQVGLELVEIDIERTIKPQRRRDRRHDLRDQAVEVLVARARDVEVAAADVVDGLVVDEERAVRVLDGAVRREDGVVRLDNRGRHAGRRVDGKLELALLAVVGGQPLEEEGAESGTRAAAEGVEDQEALEGLAVVCSQAIVSTLHSWSGTYVALEVDAPATRRTRSMTLSTISLPMV